MLVKINSKDISDLLNSGISPRTIEAIENAKKTGSVFKSKTDLLNIGVPQAEINLMTGNISFALAEPETDFKFVNIHTTPAPLSEYLLFVKHRNKRTDEFIQDIYVLDHDGKTRIRYDDLVTGENFIISVKAPNGEIVVTELGGNRNTLQEIKKADLGSARIKIEPFTAIQAANNIISIPTKLKGRLVSNKTDHNLEKIQIVFFVATSFSSDNTPDYYPVCYAETETNGYFFSSLLNFRTPTDYNNLIKAKAEIAIAGNYEIDIRLEPGSQAEGQPQGGQLPEKVILYLEETGIQPGLEKDCDCDCKDLNFHQKNTLDEFSYYTVVRTTEPLIKAREIRDVEEVDIEDLLDGIRIAPEIRTRLAGIKAPRFLFQSFINRNGQISKDNVNSLIRETQSHALKNKLKKKNSIIQGRLTLDNDNSIDWDEKATIYEAVTISHGHLLNFKQEWFADGYSIGDLLYSLPLAPGQKKQIVVFDWDRKDSASNTQRLDYQESLYNSLSRDRDINEVANATVNERMNGSSSARTGGIGGGGGGLIGGFVVGIAGGFGFGNSSASQNSSRSTTASSQQNVHDRTVQAASSVRSQRSTVIQAVSQGERFEVSAEVIANYNHCHAMTIQYFEVLRHFEITTRLANVQECLFIPLEFSPFNRKKALRWRGILSDKLMKKNLRKGFAAIERIEEELESDEQNYYHYIGYPRHHFAEEPLTYIEGELFIEFQLTRPMDEEDENGKLILDNWKPFIGFIAFSIEEFHDRFIKRQKEKDEAFYKHAGPSIAERIISSLGFYAVKRGQTTKKIPIDATLLSDFRNRRTLNVTLRMEGDFASDIKREDIDFIEIRVDGDDSWLGKIKTMMNAGARMIIHSGSLRYRTELSNDYLFRNAIIKNDLTVSGDDVRIHTPLNKQELKNPRNEDVEACNSLLHHLNENLEAYHQAIWFNMDEQRRFMLLDGVIAPGRANGRSVASVVENRLIGIVGNCLVMPVSPGIQLDPTLNDKVDLYQHYYEDPLDPIRLSLPTKGVFAEAVMGKCNSCEKKDETRFWRWEESPIPDSPTTISPINTPVPQNTQPNLQAKDFAQPIINLQNAPSIPDPQGYGALTQLMSNPNLFRDITGLAANQSNAMGAMQSSLAAAQNFAGMAKDLESQKINQQNADKILDDIRNSPELSPEEKASLIKDHLQQRIDGGQSKKAEQENQQNADTGLEGAAVKAIEKGQTVKGSSTDLSTGKSVSVEVEAGKAQGKFRVPGKVPLVLQGIENTNGCWAAGITMMKSWKDEKTHTISDVLAMIPGEYSDKFRNNQVLLESEKRNLIELLGMIDEGGPASHPFEDFIYWLNKYGPVWITIDAKTETTQFSPHANILIGYDGDGTEENSMLVFLDPEKSNEQKMSFKEFLDKYEQMVTDNPGNLYTQIVHFKSEIVGEGGVVEDKIMEGLAKVLWNFNDPIKFTSDFQTWFNTNQSAKTYFIDESPTNVNQFTIPTWLNINDFYTAFADVFPADADIIIGDRTKIVNAKYFVVHDTAATHEATVERAARGGAHLWMNINNVILSRDWHIAGDATKIETRSNTCFVHIELTQHPKLLQEVPGIKEAGTRYTYRQYYLLAFAYIVASLRKGNFLTVTMHRELDRSIKYENPPGSENKYATGHGDPDNFNWKFFYQTISYILGFPNDFAYGMEEGRAMFRNAVNHDGYINVFLDFVRGNVPFANQYGDPQRDPNAVSPYILDPRGIRTNCS